MPVWIQSNIGNIIVILLLLAVILLAVRSIVNDRRNGKSSCGSNCGACAMSGACHHHPQRRENKL